MEGDLDDIRNRKLAELQQRLQEERLVEDRAVQIDAQKRSILMGVLTPEAKNRLANIKLARPEFGVQIENLLIQIAQSGSVTQKITDQQLKEILLKISKKKRDITIRRI
ncbi:MAG: DNA-binding protein [Candidatus Hydrothermarchaeaceae archaeon]